MFGLCYNAPPSLQFFYKPAGGMSPTSAQIIEKRIETTDSITLSYLLYLKKSILFINIIRVFSYNR